MKKLLYLVVLLLMPLAGWSQTAVITGTAVGIGQTLTLPVTLQVQLVGCSPDVPRLIPSGSVITNNFSVTAAPITFIATATVYGNNIVTCNNQSYSTYAVTWNVNGRPAAPTQNYRVVEGQTCNISDGTCKPIGFYPAVIQNATGSVCAGNTVLAGYNSNFVPICQSITSSVLNFSNIIAGLGYTPLAVGATAGGDLTGTYPNPTLSGAVIRPGTTAGGDLSGTFPNPTVLNQVKLSPGAVTQTVNQTGSSTFNVNSFNSVLYAQSGNSLGTLCSAFNGTVVIPVALSVVSSATLPVTCSVQVVKGGSIQVAGGQSLTISGPFSAGLHQVFTGTGNIYFTGSNITPEVYPQWFGAMGNNTSAGFTATAGNAVVTISGRQVFNNGDSVTLVGAGVAGATLTTSVISSTSTTITLNVAPSTTVSTAAPIYTGDDTSALQLWANSVRGNATNSPQVGYLVKSSLGPSKLYVPKGQYVIGCSTSLRIYSGIIVEFESANTTHSARFYACNYNISGIRLMPFNLDSSGNLLNTSGNLILKYPAIFNNFGFISGTAAPLISFDPSPVNWSDTEIDHGYFSGVGTMLQGGFATTVSASAGATTITVADGSPFITGEQIQIAGAGTAGAVLTTTIGGCASALCSNTFTISPAIITTVSGAIVKPVNDIFGLKLNDTEMDVGFKFMNFQNNASGAIYADNLEIYQATSGFATSTGASLSLHATNIECVGCGTPNGGTSAGYGINWVDSTQSKTADLVVSHSNFVGIASSSSLESSAIMVNYLRSVSLKNNQFWNVNGPNAYKGVLIIGVNEVDITGNIFQAGSLSTTLGPMIEICCSGADAPLAAIVMSNTIQATGSNAITKAVNFDVTPIAFNTSGNIIAGNITAVGNAQQNPTSGTTTINAAACIKTAATVTQPAILGSCISVVAAGGTCTCN